MTEALLRELSNSDIDWMLAVGQIEEIDANTTLIQPDQPIEALYILLEGGLSVFIAGQAIGRLAIGEMVGAIPFLEPYLCSNTVKAHTQSWVLAIPRSQLALKLQDDPSFAAHLYRASAIFLANQLSELTQTLEPHIVLSQPQRESVTVFAELQDPDLDWLIAAGQVQHLAADTLLVRSGRPVNALHILLEGALALSTPEQNSNCVARAFSQQSQPEREFARLSKGDLIGETQFVEGRFSTMTVKCLRESRILSIPKWRLAAKLLHDVGFATRFYRVLAILLANKQQAIVQRMNGNKQIAVNLNSPNVGDQFLTQVALAEARFEWMLKRIQVNIGSGMQW
jgi:bacteriocin-type transport-associated protein